MNANETPTPRTDAHIGDQSAVVLTAGEEAMCEFARTLERELDCMRAAFDKQCSVTLGQMKTIRELRLDRGSWSHQSSEHAGLAVATGKQRDAWREDAMRLRAALPLYGITPAERDAIIAHDALVAKEGGK